MHPILDALETVVAERGDRLATADQSLRLDYRSLSAVAQGLAAQLKSATDRRQIGIVAPPSAAGGAATFACWYAGRTPVPLNFLLTPDQIGEVVRHAEIDTVIAAAPLAQPFEQAGLRTIVLSGQTLVPGATPVPDVDPDDVAALIYTSGTTGGMKGVELSFNNLARNAAACVEHAGMTPDQVFLNVLPQFHGFGFTTMTILPLTLGATVWSLPRFSAVAVVNTIQEQEVTLFFGAASMFGALLKLKRVEPDALRSLRLAVSGGEPLPRNVAVGFRQKFGVELLEGYGLTETSPVVSIRLPGEDAPDSVGRALPGIEVVAVDEHGGQLPAGAEGELVVRGHCLMRGYRGQPDATTEVLREDGLRTGDIGQVDDAGFIRITGRSKDMMIVGGENVFPREIEAVIELAPGVAEVAVIAAPDSLRGETPVAFVRAQEGVEVDPLAIRELCCQKLPGYKTPREVRIVDELPRGPTGKVLKRQLAERLASSAR